MSTKQFMRSLKAEGFSVEYTGKGHLKITHPDMDGPVYHGSTASCVRGDRNLRAAIKRRMRNAPTATD